MSKYDGIDFTPPKSVRDAAAKGLEMRRNAKEKGGLTNSEASKEGIGSGVQRAVNLKNGDKVSPETIKRMVSFFNRHSAFKKFHKQDPDGRAKQSWLLWAGDPGMRWSNKILGMMKKADEKK